MPRMQDNAHGAHGAASLFLDLVVFCAVPWIFLYLQCLTVGRPQGQPPPPLVGWNLLYIATVILSVTATHFLCQTMRPILRTLVVGLLSVVVPYLVMAGQAFGTLGHY